MPRIRCHYIDCVFIDDGYCSAAAVEIDPDLGCSTYSRADDVDMEQEWDDDESELEEWEQINLDDDDEDELWLDDDEF